MVHIHAQFLSSNRPVGARNFNNMATVGGQKVPYVQGAPVKVRRKPA